MSEFHVTLQYQLNMLFLFGGSAMLWFIPFAIAGRGNRLLFLAVLPVFLLGWFGLGTVVSNALGVSMQGGASGDLGAAHSVPIFFYLGTPVMACVVARLFGRWRGRSKGP